MTRSWVLWAFWLSFLLISSGIMHGYFWKRFVKDTELPALPRRIFGWVFALLTVLIPCSFFLRRHLIQPIDSILFLLIMSWLAMLFYFVSLRILLEPVSLGVRLHRRFLGKPDLDPSRRRFLMRSFALGTVAVGGFGVIRGTWNTFQDPRVRDVVVKLDRLPSQAHGMTIVQLCDLHIAPWTPPEFVDRVVEHVNLLRPDLVVITGDLVDGEVNEIGNSVASLGRLTSKFGAYFVSGNHEYYVETEPWMGFLVKLGMRILHNSGVTIGGLFHLAGVPDRTMRRIYGAGNPDLPNIPRALSTRPPDLPSILLVHQPREVDAAAAAGVDLQLSGHTHGGQIWPFGALVMASQPYLSGLHRHGATQIYVSRGTGTWGPPMRIAAPSEITRITLI